MTENEENIIQKVINTVLNSKRPMPAQFTSNGNRMESFCVDFPSLTADDESNMAGQAYHAIDSFNYECKSGTERSLLVKIGEDIMIGSYIINKLGNTKLSYTLCNELVEENKKIFKNTQEMNIDVGFMIDESIKRYFEYCLLFGQSVALESNEKP